jgi:carbon-monoxide dehydrogenase small subunit
MSAIALIVNGAPIRAEVTPRTHLADFLRGQLLLTGTHLGCEQGVCGACTVLIDGRPQRACLAFAIDCDGVAVTTIEGYDGDQIMAALRTAFSTHHALQCGFCTPGMLATARDIVLRLGEVDERRIREELSGNLCRCTGYVGIVRAIASVCAGRAPGPVIAPVAARAAELGAPVDMAATPTAATHLAGGPEVEERIVLAAPPDAVWAVLSDLPRVAACLPGAAIERVDGDQVFGRMALALGPIRTAFGGQATVTFAPETRSGRIAGGGRDAGSATSASGEARWQVTQQGEGSLLTVMLTWRLTGALAQFNRAGLVRDLVRRLAAEFARNLEAAIAGQPPSPSRPLSLWGLLWSIIIDRLPFRRGA